MKPALFRAFAQEYPTLPSLENLQFWLIKQDFSETAATIAAKSYLHTMELVGEINSDYNLEEGNASRW